MEQPRPVGSDSAPGGEHRDYSSAVEQPMAVSDEATAAATSKQRLWPVSVQTMHRRLASAGAARIIEQPVARPRGDRRHKADAAAAPQQLIGTHVKPQDHKAAPLVSLQRQKASSLVRPQDGIGTLVKPQARAGTCTGARVMSLDVIESPASTGKLPSASTGKFTSVRPQVMRPADQPRVVQPVDPPRTDGVGHSSKAIKTESRPTTDGEEGWQHCRADTCDIASSTQGTFDEQRMVAQKLLQHGGARGVLGHVHTLLSDPDMPIKDEEPVAAEDKVPDLSNALTVRRLRCMSNSRVTKYCRRSQMRRQ